MLINPLIVKFENKNYVYDFDTRNYKELKETLVEMNREDVILFENPDYASAFIGLSHDDRAVYSYEKMIQHLKDVEGWTEEDAIEWIDYNTLRALPYAGSEGPIIVYDTYWAAMSE